MLESVNLPSAMVRGSNVRAGLLATPRAIVAGLCVMLLTACGGGSDSGANSAPLQAAEAVSEAFESGGSGVAGTSDTASDNTADFPTADATVSPLVVMRTTLGDIRIELDPERAPVTVANFLNYVDAGHYQQAIFHRVIAGFMIQGGGFTADYQRLATEDPIVNEADNGVDNERYTIAMARTPNAHSATDQFFINVADNAFLNYRAPIDSAWGYAVFGRVVDGFDVVDQIESVTTGAAGPFTSDVPVESVIILGVDRL